MSPFSHKIALTLPFFALQILQASVRLGRNLNNVSGKMLRLKVAAHFCRAVYIEPNNGCIDGESQCWHISEIEGELVKETESIRFSAQFFWQMAMKMVDNDDGFFYAPLYFDIEWVAYIFIHCKQIVSVSCFVKTNKTISQNDWYEWNIYIIRYNTHKPKLRLLLCCRIKQKL